jgi:hypothetical protein
MVRLALRHNRFTPREVRTGSRRDPGAFAWLVAAGFFGATGDGSYRLTPAGRRAAKLGHYQVRLPPAPGGDQIS